MLEFSVPAGLADTLRKLNGFEDHPHASRTSDDILFWRIAAMEDVIRVELEFHYEDMLT